MICQEKEFDDQNNWSQAQVVDYMSRKNHKSYVIAKWDNIP